MEVEAYDGIPIPELPIHEVDWEHRGEYVRTRSKRKGPDEFDVEPEWATEAVMDSRAVIRPDRASRSGEGLRVTGHSAAAGRVLVVILIPKEHPPTGAWWGLTLGRLTTATALTTRRRHDPKAECRGRACRGGRARRTAPRR